MRILKRFLGFSLVGLLYACSAGSSAGTSPAIPPAGSAAGVPASSARSVILGPSATRAALPVVARITASMLFPAVASTSTLTLAASATAPAGVVLENVKRASSGTLTVYEYVSITAAVTTTLPSIPAISLTFPVSTPLAGKSVFYGISDISSQGGKVSFNTQGPGTIDVQTVSFASVPAVLTFLAGHKYTFVVYATTSNAQLLYVTNPAAKSITAYAVPAQGNVAPVRTIAGPATGLSDVRRITADASGKLFIANSGFVEIFAHGANGNVPPSKTFPIPGVPGAIAVDPANGDIYVAVGQDATDAIAIDALSASGTLLRSITTPPNDFSRPLIIVHGLAVDEKSELVAGVFSESRADCVLHVRVFAPSASGEATPIMNGPAWVCGYSSAEIGYASSADQVFVFRPPTDVATGPGLFAYVNGSFTIARELDDVNAGPLAVDAAGANVYAINGTNSIGHFSADAGSSFAAGTPISGSNTGLAQPSSLAIGTP